MLNAAGQAQHILLLGGTSEIGVGIARELLSAGPAKITLAARKDSPRVADSKRTLENAGASEVNVIDFDATDYDSHPGVLDEAFAAGDVDIAVVAFGT